MSPLLVRSIDAINGQLEISGRSSSARRLVASGHRAAAGCKRMYFGMSVSDTYPAATVNVAAVAKHHVVKAVINMSQMTLSQMSITEATLSGHGSSLYYPQKNIKL
jgi:hypothetical protein